jgi:hypothetical protein
MINLQNISPDVLGQIFSFLDPADLGHVALVCRNWNGVQKADWLWKRHCLAILDRDTAPCGSWKEQYRTFHNVRAGIAEVSHLHTPFVKWNVLRPPFTVLDDSTALEVNRDLKNRYLYQVCDFINHTIISTLDLSGHGTVFASDIHESVWTVLTSHGEILGFNILTGECVYQMQGEPLDHHWLRMGHRPKIHCADHEVTIWDGQKITIWDVQSKALVQTMGVVLDEEVQVLRTTPHFVALMVNDIHSTRGTVNFIGRVDQSVHEIDAICNSFCLDSFGPYIACVRTTGRVEVFVDSPEGDLQLASGFFPSTKTEKVDRLSIYKNWLYLGCYKNIFLYDIHSGTKIATIPGLNGWAVRGNADVLFARTVVGAPFCSDCYHDVRYDFKNGVQRLVQPPEGLIRRIRQAICEFSKKFGL